MRLAIQVVRQRLYWHVGHFQVTLYGLNMLALMAEKSENAVTPTLGLTGGQRYVQ
jgi:hypothetical protein